MCISQRGMRPQSGHRAQYAYHDTSKQQHSGYLETLIYDVDVVKSDAMRTSKNIESIRWSEVSFWDLSAPSWSRLSVQEHREETLIYDVDVVKRNAMKKSKKTESIWWSEGSFWDLSVPPWSHLSVQEHWEETLIYDVDVVKSNAMTKSKNTGQILWSEGPFWDTLGPSFCQRALRGDIDLWCWGCKI